MPALPLALCVLLLASCSTQSTSVRQPAPSASQSGYRGGDGSSREQAVVIVNASSTAEGIAAEYRWLAEHMPGARRRTASLLEGRPKIEVILVEHADGRWQPVYFDISAFYGR